MMTLAHVWYRWRRVAVGRTSVFIESKYVEFYEAPSHSLAAAAKVARLLWLVPSATRRYTTIVELGHREGLIRSGS